MSDHQKKVPITNKKTGATSFGTSAKSQTLPTEKNTTAGRDFDRVSVLGDSGQGPAPGVTLEAGDFADQQREPQAQDEFAHGDTKKAVRAKIESLEQFIAHAYSRRGQRVTLLPPVEKLLCQQPRLDNEAKARLLDLARDDGLLAVPRQLLLACRDVTGFHMLKNAVREFVGEVLARHPVFAHPDLSAALHNLQDAPDPDQTLALVATLDLGSILPPTDDKPISPKAIQQLRANATYCLAVWFVETRGLGLDRLNQCLFAALWTPAADAVKTETDRFRLLTEIRDMAGVGLAAANFKQQVDARTAALLVAKRAQETLQEQNAILREREKSLQDEVRERDTRIAELEQALAREKQDYEHSRIHLKDDYKQLRTRVLRRLKAEVSLLTDGLHALRRVPPKPHVMDDHAERALDGLKKEIHELESGE